MTSQFIHFALVFLPLSLAAQPPQDRSEVPLNNWPAPRQVPRSQLQSQLQTRVRAVAPEPQMAGGAGGQSEKSVPTPKLQLPGSIATDALILVPVTPCRLADTRPGSGYPALGSTPLAKLTPRTLPIIEYCGTSDTVRPEAFSLNVTVVPPSGTPGGYLLVYPDPITPVPLAASMTWNPGASYQTAAVVAAASPDGSVNVVASFPTDVVIDINGYYAPPTDSEFNTALGAGAMAASANKSGDQNTAVGEAALGSNTTGSMNTAVGNDALAAESGGFGNTALGYDALGNATGSGNLAIGEYAGSNIRDGNGNIMIGDSGTAEDVNTMRIGTYSITATYISGILGNTLSGASPVVINANGQLGIEAVSSRRYKEDIQDMGDASNSLLRLRPVTFHYKKPEADGSKPLEYGLIAEEVAAVYPELVIRGADGQIESVQYAKLPAMLLNELQKEYRHSQEQDETIRKLEARVAALELQSTRSTAEGNSNKAVTAAGGGR
jgi:Chaperone of endosialidase